MGASLEETPPYAMPQGESLEEPYWVALDHLSLEGSLERDPFQEEDLQMGVGSID